MRILVFNPSYPPMRCGIGEYARGLAQALAEDGHDVTVVTSSAVVDAVVPDEGPRALPVLPDWGIKDYLRALPRFARPRPDVVVSGYPSVLPGRYARLMHLLPALAKLTLGSPRVTFVVHEFVHTEEAGRRWLALALRVADDVVAVTAAERDAVINRYPWATSKTRVVENPSTIPALPVDADAAIRLREGLNLDGRPLVAFSGLLSSPQKGFTDLLRAIGLTDAVLAATGSLDDTDPHHAEVAALIEELALGNRVRWLGYLDRGDLARLLQAADAVVLPFRGGAASGYTSLLAALVNGAAVVTTRGPFLPDWLRHGETALLVEPGDVEGLAAAIRALAHGGDQARRLSAGARDLAPRFGWPRVARSIIASL